MSTYEVTTEDGSVYQIETEDTQPTHEMSVGERIAGGAMSALSGLTFGLGDEVTAGGNAALDAIPSWLGGQGKNLSQAYDDRLAQTRGIQKEYSAQQPVADTILNLAGALKLPIASAVKAGSGLLRTGATLAAEGAGYGAAYGFGSGEGGLDERLANADDAAGTGAIGGALVGGAAKGIGTAAGAINKALPEIGRKLEMSAFGATKTNIKKAIDRMPDVLDKEGNFQNPISEAITAFKEAGGHSVGMEAEPMIAELNRQRDGLTKSLTKRLSAADEVQTDVVIPKFSITDRYVEGLPGVEKESARKMADELIDATVNNTDGTLMALQSEKEGISGLIQQSAWGQDSASQMRVNLLKRIRADVRKTIEDSYEQLTGDRSGAIKRINAAIGKRETLTPLFEDLLASSEARTPLKSMIQTIRTSGGVGQTAAALVAGSGLAGAPLGGALALGNLYAQTPQGKEAIANAARSEISKGIFGGTSAVGNGISLFAPKVSGVLGSRRPQDDSTPLDTGDPLLSAVGSRSLKMPDPSIQADLESPFLRDEQQDTKRRNQGSKLIPSSYNSTTPDPIQAAFNTLKANSYGDSEDMDVDKLVQAVIGQESGGNAKTKPSVKGAIGLMQIMPDTAKEIAQELGYEKYDLTDPETNQAFGTYYLQKMLNQFGDPELALAAYNAGPGRVKSWMDKYNTANWSDIARKLKAAGAYSETTKYVPSVLSRLAALEAVQV